MLAGKRADGEAPRSANGKVLPEKVIEGAQKRLKKALGMPKHREPTAEELARLDNGLMANGRMIDRTAYRRQIHATKSPIGFVDLTLSADKSLSTAWALATSTAERETLYGIHKRAVAATMAYVEKEVGFTQRGGANNRRLEPGELAWISFDHFTARPAVDIERHDEAGRTYTETREVPSQVADPQLHTHVTVLNSVLTEGGHVGALDLDLLKGRIKEFGAVYQANVATCAREHGIETVLDKRTGAARFTAIPDEIRELFSKRTAQAEHAARELAQRKGVDWDAATGEQKIALLKAGASETRQTKEDAPNDFAVWREQAEQIGYRHQTIIGQRPQARPETDNPQQDVREASTTPIPLDPLSQDLMRAITDALGTRDPAEQVERLIEGIDRAVFVNAGSEEPNSAVAKSLWRVARSALTADPSHVERILSEGTREAIRRASARLDPRYDQPIQAEKDLATADDHRRLAAYRAALPTLEDRFKRNAVIDAQELREIAARALIVTGIGEKPGEDIDAVLGMFRERGVMQDGQEVKLMWGAGMAERGKEARTQHSCHQVQSSG